MTNKNEEALSQNDEVFVPEDPAEAEAFDPGYPHTYDVPDEPHKLGHSHREGK